MPTRIPLRVPRLEMRRRKPQYIIIHHTVEMYPQTGIHLDNTKLQMQDVWDGVLEKGAADMDYHFIIERMGADYVPTVCRPLVTFCDFEDIPENINNAAIHIALMGSYNEKIPEPRLYEIMAYRLINPLLKMYALPPNRVKLHSEVSTHKDLSCPGTFFDKAILLAQIRRFVLR
jgi:hypothetical protein